MAIRDNPIAAGSMGVNTALFKSLAFGVSALYTGVAGALGADHELARWCEAMRAAARQGKLSPKRLAYLKDVGLAGS